MPFSENTHSYVVTAGEILSQDPNFLNTLPEPVRLVVQRLGESNSPQRAAVQAASDANGTQYAFLFNDETVFTGGSAHAGNTDTKGALGAYTASLPPEYGDDWAFSVINFGGRSQFNYFDLSSTDRASLISSVAALSEHEAGHGVDIGNYQTQFLIEHGAPNTASALPSNLHTDALAWIDYESAGHLAEIQALIRYGADPNSFFVVGSEPLKLSEWENKTVGDLQNFLLTRSGSIQLFLNNTYPNEALPLTLPHALNVPDIQTLMQLAESLEDRGVETFSISVLNGNGNETARVDFADGNATIRGYTSLTALSAAADIFDETGNLVNFLQGSVTFVQPQPFGPMVPSTQTASGPIKIVVASSPTANIEINAFKKEQSGTGPQTLFVINNDGTTAIINSIVTKGDLRQSIANAANIPVSQVSTALPPGVALTYESGTRTTTITGSTTEYITIIPEVTGKILNNHVTVPDYFTNNISSFQSGGINSTVSSGISQVSVDTYSLQLIVPNTNLIQIGNILNPNAIGAFYEGGALGYDESASIANQTGRLFNDSAAVTANQLISLDTTGDGIIDQSDAAFTNLTVWEDANEDGIVDDGEMLTVDEAGISAISLDERSAIYTAGNSNSVVEKDMSALETSLPGDESTAPTLDYDYYRNTFNPTAAWTVVNEWNAGHAWQSTEVKITDDWQYAIGTSGGDTMDYRYGINGYYTVIPNMAGGDGNDLLHSDQHNLKLWGDAGDDSLAASMGDDTLIGGTGNDIVQGFGFDDTLRSLGAGETDNDLLFGGAGEDLVVGGVGNDTINAGADDDVIDGFYGFADLNTPDAKHELVGSETDDDLIFAGGGNDGIFGNVGNDTIFGDDGNDTILGFNAYNDPKQTLSETETDNDLISGGAGNDTILGGTGNDEAYGGEGEDLVFGYGPTKADYSLPAGETDNDTLWGGAGDDQLQGQQGNDFLLGQEGNDLLFGQLGDDTIYGAGGNDILVGFTGYNEEKQSLSGAESDDDFLYGGAGADTLVGGVGNDYLDGGAGADTMEGDDGDDTYIVNTLNDVVLERQNAGTDTVFSAVNYLLSSEVENLYLLGADDINGSGNKRDNAIYGTAGSNILDGETGVDTMLGYAGDDTYYVDNVGDVVVENADEGNDTVNASISWTLGTNQENLTLLSYNIPESGVIDGLNVLVYGYPKRYELDYAQGDKNVDYRGTCALVAISNVITQAGGVVSEEQVVDYAQEYTAEHPEDALIVIDSNANDNGASTKESQQAILSHFGFTSTAEDGVHFEDMADKIKNGQGVLLAVNCGLLWDNDAYIGVGNRNHVVTVTGVVYSSDNSRIVGFYIADSGRGLVTDMTRYLSYDDLYAAANVTGGYMIYTNENPKLWDVAIDGTGNELDNIIKGTEGNNVLDGGAGADYLVGGEGNDTYFVDNAGDLVFENEDEGTDLVNASVSFTIVGNIENLTLTGTDAISGTGNSGDNIITGNIANNTLDGGAGNDTLIGGDGDDTYVIDSSDDVITEQSNEGVDTVLSSVSYALSAELENLTLTGDSALVGTGNAANNVLTNASTAAGTLTGGAGDDTYVISNANDTLDEIADQGMDTVQSSASYTLAANIENLVLTGGSALSGGGNELNNNISSNDAASTLAGGDGDDTYFVSNGDAVIVENASEGMDAVVSAVDYTLSANVENLTLTGSGNLAGTGNAFGNVIIGNAGNNTIDGGAGVDTMDGGAGDDYYSIDNSGDVINENAEEGTDTVLTGVNYTLADNVENVILEGSSAIAVTGNAQNNVFTDNSGNSTLAGGAGNDSYTITNSGTIIVENSDEGTDSVTATATYTLGANLENIILGGTSAIDGAGNGEDNVLTGNTAANALDGAGGSDTLDGGAGVDTMTGGTGDDLYYVDDASDSIVENSGDGKDSVVSSVDHTLAANVENLTLTGTALSAAGNSDSNYLIGTTGANTVVGGDGDDTLDGGAGTDSMVGGTGNDTYFVGSTSDVVVENSGEGTDTVVSSIDYTLLSNFENLMVTGSTYNALGNSADNIITGNSANNWIDGKAGADTMAGGAGDDVYLIDSASDTAIENADEGLDVVVSTVSYTLGANIEQLQLNGGTIGFGNELDNYILGYTLNNSLVGGAGNDTLSPGTGSDTMYGGTGDDVYYVDDVTDVVVEDADEGTDLVISIATMTLGANFENLTLGGISGIRGTGNTLANYITGNSGNNSLTGADGNDTLDGNGGTDTLVGGLGDDWFIVDSTTDVMTEAAGAGTDTEVASFSDTLQTNIDNLILSGTADINGTGNTVNNVITGNAGNNILNGGTGIDTLIGEAGDDTYVVDSTTDTITEDINAGIDEVQSSVTYTLGNNLENLTLSGTTTSGYGNSLNNSITGTAYANSLFGSDGNDTLDGGGGADTMDGGAGDDTYFVNLTTDVIIDTTGIDTVNSAIDYTLASFLENLTLTGTSAIDGTGNAADNVITGNSGANILNGLTGTDTLIGEAGSDTYVVDDLTDVIVENPGEGTDTVQTSISYSLGANLEKLLITGSASVAAGGNELANTLTGSTGNDTLDGGAGVDSMAGGVGDDTYVVDNVGDIVTEAASAGNDTVLSSVTYTLDTNVENLVLTGTADINAVGNTLASVITGNSGNNVIDATPGTLVSTLSGGQGDDTYIIDAATDQIIENANEGIDTVQATFNYTLGANVENLTLSGAVNTTGVGNELDNHLIGGTYHNTLIGGAGNDILEGGTTYNNSLVGGTGDDVYYVDIASDVVTELAGEGADTVYSSVTYSVSGTDVEVENLILTGTGNINATGNELNNAISGNVGNNSIDGGAGADTMTGGAGNDTYVVDNAGDAIIENAGEGTDIVQSSIDFDLALAENVEKLTLTGTDNIAGTGNALDNTIVGNSGNNVLLGATGNDSLVGNAGDDIIDGGTGADTMVGGAGNDIYFVDSASDVITEASGAGSDTAFSSISYTLGTYVEQLVLIGTDDISATGSGSANIIIGNSGNNTLDGGAGNDTMRGGLGDDIYILNVVTDDVSEDPDAGIDTVQIAASYTLGANLENLTFTSTGAYVGTGNELDNYMTGNSGANTLIGGDGNDTLNGGTGNDSMVGGTGDDSYFVNVATDVLVEDSDPGTDTVFAAVNYSLLTNFENLTLTGSGLNGYGNAADNKITGDAGVNVIFGYAGNDTLDGGASFDLLYGGTGDDYYFVDNASDSINENSGEGTDTVEASINYSLTSEVEKLLLAGAAVIGTGNILNNTITGNDFDNSLSGGTGNDTLNGGVGGDTLDGGTGDDSMVGGAGDDSYFVDAMGDTIVENANEGVDLVYSSITYSLDDNLENLTLTDTAGLSGTGNSADNYITGNSGANSLYGEDGNDTLDGDSGIDTLLGGLGDDVFFVDSSDVIIENADEGADTVNASFSYTLSSNVENLTLTGGSAIDGTGNELDNVLTGNSAANSLIGADGNDTLDGGAGADTLIGGTGDDVYFVDSGSDIVTENSDEGIDVINSAVSYTLSANVETLTLTGESAIDATGNALDNVMTGNSAANSLSGDAGNDTLDGAAGADTMTGGTGDDVYFVDSASDVVNENTSEGSDTINSSVSLTLAANVENLILSDGAALDGTGNSLDNVLTGNTYDNALTGAAGNDTLYGGGGVDTLVGGTGDDIYFVDSTTDVVTENNGEGTDTINTSVSWSLGANIENVTLTGSAAVNAGGNTLDNTIIGNDSANILFGAEGNDSIVGGGGFDLIDGGTGDDTMLGGTGNDTYFVDSSADSVIENADEGTDTVDSTITYSLGIDVENLTLLMSDNIDGSGNDLDNRIIGNSGDNSLVGGAGNDTLNGSTGTDTLLGGTGDDLYYVDDASDILTENPDEGTDSVISSISWTLGSDFENLTLTGWANLTGAGNSSDNMLTGAYGNDTLSGADGNDTLDGGRGQDSMTGGLGDDTFFVNDAGDVVTENTAEGTDTVSSSVSFSLGANLENLTLTGTDNSRGDGNDADNTMSGNIGDNYLSGGAGNDSITASDGNDTLDGGTGVDTLIGGLGDDTYYVDSANDVITEAEDEGFDTVRAEVNWTLAGNFENLTLQDGATIGEGNSEDNYITGTTDADSLTGGDGNDTIYGGDGSDTMIGGAGDDLYYVGSSGDLVTEAADEGTDSLVSGISYTLGSNVENLQLSGYGAVYLDGTGNELDNVITGDRGNNQLWGLLGNDSLVGAEGDDTLDGGAGDDTMAGGAGNDIYIVDSADDLVQETNYFDGLDTVQSSVDWTLGSNLENLELQGTAVNGTGNSWDNYIAGNAANNVLTDDFGNDILDGGAGADTMTGGRGDDIYFVDDAGDSVVEASGFGYDVVFSTASAYTLALNVEALQLNGTADISGYGSEIDDLIVGNSGANTIEGGDGDDSLFGNDGNDSLLGNDGNDTIYGGDGVDILTGGLGDDVYFVDAVDSVVELAGQGYDAAVSTLVGYTLVANVEELVLDGTSDISGTGNGLDNLIIGNIGDNTLDGGAGNDWVEGGEGDDVFIGGSGDDTLVGGAGNDTYYVPDGNDLIIEAEEGGVDVIVGLTSIDLSPAGFETIENVTLDPSAGAASIIGSTRNNVLTGNDYNNSLDGGWGNDTLYGGAGDDYLYGGDGDDSMYGGSGNNTLVGGAGNDTYYVPQGNDLIIEGAGGGIDTIHAYVSGVDLSAPGFEYFENVTIDDSALSNSTATGNALDNVLIGNAYNNTLTGGAGNDTLDGGAGVYSDYLYGGTGDDVYLLGSGINSDFVYESSGEGTDSVLANYTYSLGSDVENLTLTGSGNINATGNSLDNVLTGNAGTNSLSGGAGDDKYVVGIGDGTDVISDSSGTLDKVSFDSSLSEDDIAFFMSGNDLKIGFVDSSGDLITVSGQTVSGTEVERFELSDGNYLSDADVNQVIQDMSTYATAHGIAFTSVDDVKNNADLMNIVATAWHA